MSANSKRFVPEQSEHQTPGKTGFWELNITRKRAWPRKYGRQLKELYLILYNFSSGWGAELTHTYMSE